nr:hypothetical protein [uncultured Caproiciproducens sp.]
MRKGTIFRYELKRLFCSKEYLLLLAVSIAYCLVLLRGSVIYGTGFTAPFSQWTFCSYLSSAAVLLFILLLALCARQFTTSERRVMTIIEASSIQMAEFRAIRYAAIACAFLTAMGFSFGTCFVFYRLVFDYTGFGSLIYAGLILLLPPALFLFGAAMILGYKKQALVYILLAIVLILGAFGISLPACIDLIGISVIRPLYDGVQKFTFSTEFLAGRAAFAIAGIALIIFSLIPVKRADL